MVSNSMEELGFGESESKFEDVVIGDLTDVKEEKFLIPPSANVKFRIKKVEAKANKDNTWKWLGLQLQIVDGINDEGKYKNKVVFANIPYFADTTKYDQSKPFFGKQQYRIPLKQLLLALGYDIKTTALSGAVLADMKDKYVVGNIVISKGKDGYDDSNEVKNITKCNDCF